MTFLGLAGTGLFILAGTSSAIAGTTTTSSTTTTQAKSEKPMSLSELCMKSLTPFPGESNKKALKSACEKVQVLDGCTSTDGVPIFYYDRKGINKEPANILVFSLIHGDETPAGSVGRFWMERLETIEPRNNWRVVPVLNPDGVKAKTRVNANKVDLNRNFPTKDWNDKAMPYWSRATRKNPRRYPGPASASEVETRCAVKYIEDFKPDFIVSIHTPLTVLDFDGPKVKPPKFDYLPWRSLGNYPGSLGRFMWYERKTPVLTMELKEDLPHSNQPLLKLQDIIGVLVSLEDMKKPKTLQAKAAADEKKKSETKTKDAADPGKP
jgi:hypothetical protein